MAGSRAVDAETSVLIIFFQQSSNYKPCPLAAA